MQLLHSFPLPLESGAPPTGFAWPERPMSDVSTRTGFVTGLNARDTFFGTPSCVICGVPKPLQHCHVIPKSEQETVSQISCTSLSNINIRHSGQTSRTVNGCLKRPKVNLTTSHAMASCCVQTTIYYLMVISFLSVSSQM
jgi:hypothetical protein